MSDVHMGMMLMIHYIMHAVCAEDYIPSPQSKFLYDVNINIIESVDSICRDSADTQYMLIQTNFSKSPKR